MEEVSAPKREEEVEILEPVKSTVNFTPILQPTLQPKKPMAAAVIDEYLAKHPDALQQWRDKILSARKIAEEPGMPSHSTVNTYLKTLP